MEGKKITKTINSLAVNGLKKMLRSYYVISGKDNDIEQQVTQYTKEGKYDEAYFLLGRYFKDNEQLEFAIRYKDNEPIFYIFLAEDYMNNHNYNAVLDLCSEYFKKKLSDDTDPFYYKMKKFKYQAEWKLEMFTLSRNGSWNLAKTSAAGYREVRKIKNEAYSDFLKIDKEYIQNINKIPINERRYLLFVDDYKTLITPNISPIKIQSYSENKILQFPEGHPIKNQLYIAHPYLPKKYFIFEDYELELLEDKLREYCYFAQCIGAKEIKIGCEYYTINDEYNSSKKSVSGELKYKAKVSAAVNKTNSNDLLNRISKSINLEQKFTPNSKPFIPEDLVWYHNEESWQRLYKQRITGGLKEHKELLSISKNQSIENNKLLEISAELDVYDIGIKGNYITEQYNNKKINQDLAITINILF